ncbi:hypothetical protein [Comamonas terrigena]|uniref:hypothetical protein n=1 Tax=Comamonas terrigena TaxID=32013 RepID=UPI00244C9CBF|nr:hypothetical protein [Comamonas terrigena]MDH1703537.1 hypothetical protein [Comamonas terrigena]
MDSSFFTSLYDGFRAEHYVAGLLFGAGLEAFKLPADFGFDLVVTNQKETVLSEKKLPSPREVRLPYMLQVKSRKFKPSDFTLNSKNRLALKVDFWISNREIDLVQSTDAAYFVFVIRVEEKPSELAGRNLLFWVHSSHIAELRKNRYLREETPPDWFRRKPGETYARLMAEVRLKPQWTKEDFVESLWKKLNAPAHKEVTEWLLEQLPQRFDEPGNSSEYIGLRRPYANGEPMFAVRQIPDKWTKISEIGQHVELRELMK